MEPINTGNLSTVSFGRKRAVNALLILSLVTILLTVIHLYLTYVALTTTSEGSFLNRIAKQYTRNKAQLYSNDRFFYHYKCPGGSTHLQDITDGDGMYIPYIQETCTDSKNNLVEIYTTSRGALDKEIPEREIFFQEKYISPSRKEIVVIRGGGIEYFNKVVKSFGFD